ncbi:MAG TPA: class III extradiol dioxygenase subunit B-like domain-containing protein [Pilimelia sp.]|nr:class III extradiol dioxygenase subunit B-like domain-containing protein [Pilimelia sp.]
MPLVAAAVCPHPPALVPEIAAGAAAELNDLRAACDAAVDRLLGSPADRLLVVGSDSLTREHPSPFYGSFAPWGVPLDVQLGDGMPRRYLPLPLSLLVAAWLLRRRAEHPRAERPMVWSMRGIAQDADPADCVRLGESIDDPRPWAALVMGDGTACRGVKAPGYDDPRAQPYDDRVAEALAGADAAALRGLDPELSAQLLVAGRAPWQVLAGAAAAAGDGWRGDLTYYAAPYGVAYFVASWESA